MAAKHPSRGARPAPKPRARLRPPVSSGAALDRTVDWRGLVEKTARALGRSVETSAREALGTWLERLSEWNAKMDLTAARTPSELVDLMVADALFLAPSMPSGARVIDVGTGAGSPGLALALLRGDLRVTLVEPLGKRMSFVRTVVGAVDRADITLAPVRGETFAGRNEWDVALSRATLAPGAWLSLGVTLVAPGGVVNVLLAREDRPSHPQALMVTDEAYAWPLTGAARRAVAYRFIGAPLSNPTAP